ncbi:hypothetical protein BABA_15632 [Neobacillus bataviensis LMG 21833]|uniref:Uncharacterized protein n=1 Tax=Neobacillus bataviensis LMG 21833 TaxID=1117379 RepID=K6DE39_9BACI|nr:hypothetical protein [Neobacillus bataviensis]EKN66554.1 hypothetical protein BABA_15632 [Neobacillus bataviensis LMG 21833]
MKMGGILGLTILLVLIFLSQWPTLKKSEKKVKMAFLSLMLVNWILAVLLVIFPEMPGPGQLIDFIFKSFGAFW